MAQVPNVPAPSVQPSAAPSPTQQLDAPAEAFGANVVSKSAGDVAQATGKVGDQLAQYAQQMAAIDNKQAADNASIKAASALYDMAANYRANNTQAAAYNNLPDFAKQVEETRAQFGQGLSPLAKAEFEAASRRSAFGVLSETSNYAAQQRRVAITDTAQAAVKLAGDQLAANPDDLDAQQDFQRTLGTQAAQVFQTTGLAPDDPQVREWMKQQASPVYGSMVKQAYDSGDLTKAHQLLNDHRDDMTEAMFTQLSGALRVADHANTIQSAANVMVNGGLGPADRDAVWSAIKTQESGNRPGVAGPVTQFGQAHGLTQVLDSTGKGVAASLGIPWQPELMRGTTPAAAAYQEKIGRAYWDQAMAAEGGDVHRALEYYYGGPDESKWGPKTREYAQTVMAKAQGASPGTFAPLPFSASMTADEYVASGDTILQNRAQQMFPNDAVAQQQAFNAAHQRLSIQAQQIRATQGALYDKLDGFVIANGTTDISAVQKAYPTEWSQLPSKYQQSLERDVLFQGSQETPERQANYAKYQGLAMTQPNLFADPVKTDLKADQNLSSSDRKSLENLQRQMYTSEQNKQARSAQLKTYLANPLVANMVSRTWPTADDKRSDDYASFLGALDGQLQHLQAQTGKLPTQDEITKAAQTLITTHTVGGVNFLGMNFGGTQAGGHNVPSEEAQKINNAYRTQFGRDLSAAEVAQIYFYNKGVQ